MHLYKAYHSSEQNVFHHSAEGNDQNLQPIVSLVAALAESSFGERICKIRFGLFSGARLRRASLDSAATVIKKSLDEEAAFAQTEKLSFKCFFIEKQSFWNFSLRLDRLMLKKQVDGCSDVCWLCAAIHKFGFYCRSRNKI